MATIKDIAREAGVSHGTVSNVLNKTGKVSVEKIQLVLEAAKRLGYMPNAQAQGLRRRTPTSVAVILPSLREDTYLDFYTALQLSLRESGYEASVHTTDDIAGKEETILETLPHSSLTAVVTISCLSGNCIARYEELPCPVVFIDREPDTLKPGNGFLSFDFLAAGTALGQYVLEQGWKKIALFSAPGALRFTKQLSAGLGDALEDSPASVQRFTSDFSLAVNKAFDIVQSDTDFDVIITGSTLRAEAVVSAYSLAAKPQPAIVTLGSFRSFPLPYFSTYELDYSLMGARTAGLLTRHLQEQKPLPARTILPAKGFSFRFPQIIRQKPQTLTMLTLDTPSTSSLEKLLPMFEAVSDITLKLVPMTYEDLHTQINMLNQNFTYDLIRMDVARLDTLGKKTYMPLEQAGITPDILPQKLIHRAYDNYSLVDGTIYSLPFDPSVQIFLYRSDLFRDDKLSRAYYERYHEPLEVPRSVDQYLRVAEFFTASANPDSPTRYGTTITCGAAATAASDFLPYYLADSCGICDSQGRIQLDTPQMVRAMEKYLAMARFSTQLLWWRDNVRQFADGTVACTAVCANHAAYVINSKHSSVVGKIGASVIPGGHPLLGGGIIGISRYSRKIDACRQFFHWYYSPDVASLLVRLGGTSPLVDAFNDFKNFSLFPWLGASKKSFEIGVRGTGPVTVPGFSIYRYEFALGTAVRSLLTGVMSPAEAAAMARSMYDAADEGRQR